MKKIKVTSIFVAVFIFVFGLTAAADIQLRFGIASGTRPVMVNDPSGTFSDQILRIRPGVFLMRAHRLSRVTVQEVQELLRLLQVSKNTSRLYHMVHDNFYMDAVLLIDLAISSPEEARASLIDMGYNGTQNRRNALFVRPVRTHLIGAASPECPSRPQNESIYEFQNSPMPPLAEIVLQPTSLLTLREAWTVLVEGSCGPIDQKKGGGG